MAGQPYPHRNHRWCGGRAWRACSIADPVRAQNGKVVGVVVLRIKAHAVAGILDAAQAGGRVPFLIDGDGVLIHHPDAACVYTASRR